MKRTKFLSAIIGLSPCLMAASTNNYFSQAYGIYITPNATSGPVASDTRVKTIMSTRDDKMADVSITYDVFSMKHYFMYTVDKPYFQVFYRVNVKLYEQVKYANGLGGWFTEVGNVALEMCEVYATFNSWGDSDFHNRITYPLSNFEFKNTINPYLNQNFYGVFDGEASSANQVSGRFNVNCNTYFDDDDVAYYGLTKINQPKVKAQFVCLRDDNFNERVKHTAEFTHESYPCNGESLTYYGDFSLVPPDGTNSISFDLTLFAFATIARGSGWGMCQNSATVTMPITLTY